MNIVDRDAEPVQVSDEILEMYRTVETLSGISKAFRCDGLQAEQQPAATTARHQLQQFSI